MARFFARRVVAHRSRSGGVDGKSRPGVSAPGRGAIVRPFVGRDKGATFANHGTIEHLAEAALHYAKVTKAANETHADCLRIITRAESRMADEVDRGQASGEVAKPNQPVSQYVQGSDIPRLE